MKRRRFFVLLTRRRFLTFSLYLTVILTVIFSQFHQLELFLRFQFSVYKFLLEGSKYSDSNAKYWSCLQVI
ncbi:hypothetical protein Ddye_014131 [Dipteronia dyeriana]|uniref:Uncharacterized protein n=1 Tax=Dipteronia dyeriana TaxID=168575 RepID=A0AAD9X7M8_9ROSI|nr:hypothetical protein Ddye_014131 [Dipteronia dyeriana]